MIVISGALVLVALVLLIIGLVSTSLPFVYASIAVSVVSFVFLLIGILQRRNEQLPEDGVGETAAPAQPADVEGVTAIIPASRAPKEDVAPAAAEQDAPVSGNVLVVAGRPRYHVSGCRYLTGKDADEVSVQSARDEGFTACGVCKPDAKLAEEAAAEPHPQPDAEVPAPAEETAAEATDVEPVDVEPADVPDPVTAARKTTRATPTEEPGRTPAVSATKKAAAKKAPAKAATPAKAPAKKAAAKKAAPAKAAPSKAAAAAVEGTPAAAAAAKSGNVVVIPDRGKFHTPQCRYVRGVEDAKELSRTAATRQGYDACGVCKP